MKYDGTKLIHHNTGKNLVLSRSELRSVLSIVGIKGPRFEIESGDDTYYANEPVIRYIYSKRNQVSLSVTDKLALSLFKVLVSPATNNFESLEGPGTERVMRKIQTFLYGRVSDSAELTELEGVQ